MKFKGAIFDMDGTVIDSLSFWDLLWRRIGETYMNDESFKPSDEVNKNVRTMIYADAMAYFKEYYKIPVRTEDFIRFASESIDDFYKNKATAKVGAKELLSFLKAKGIKLCLASATNLDRVKKALQAHGLLEYFDFVISCADIGKGKEHPDIYIKAKELMGLSEAEICVVEDSFVALETAKNAGFQTVGVYDFYSPAQHRLEKAADIYLNREQNLSSLIGFLQI